MKLLRHAKRFIVRKRKNTKDEYSHEWKIEHAEKELHKAREELLAVIPMHLRDTFADLSYIAGGAIYSLYNNKEVKDYDFLLTDKYFADKLTGYFTRQAKYTNERISGGTYKGLPLIITENAISLGKFQIITRWVGEPIEVVNQFDFMHNTYYYLDGKIEALGKWDYLKSNQLIYNKERARDICGTIMRIHKFTDRGMKIKHKEIAKILLKLNDVGFNEKELEVLRDKQADLRFGS